MHECTVIAPEASLFCCLDGSIGSLDKFLEIPEQFDLHEVLLEVLHVMARLMQNMENSSFIQKNHANYCGVEKYKGWSEKNPILKATNHRSGAILDLTVIRGDRILISIEVTSPSNWTVDILDKVALYQTSKAE